MGGKFRQKRSFLKKDASTSRKDLRKKLRKEKKAKKNEYFKNKNKLTTPSRHSDENVKKKELKSKKIVQFKTSSADLQSAKLNLKTDSIEERNKSHKKEIKEKAKLERGMIKTRKKMLLEANIKEDKEIKKLEKQLKINKRKTKAIPKSFTEEGLDYLLEACETNNPEGADGAETNFYESDSEFEDDFALVTGKKRKFKNPMEKAAKKNKSSSVENNDYESNDTVDNPLSKEKLNKSMSLKEIRDRNLNVRSDNDNASSDLDINDEDEDSEIVEESLSSSENSEIDESSIENEDANLDRHSEHNVNKNKSLKGGSWEDIYGRLRDKDGNIIQAKDENKYIPPHQRAEQLPRDIKKSEDLIRLRKQLKGLVNRLAESNMHSICNQIDDLYMRNSRNDMNDTLLALITEALVSPVLTAETLVMEHTMLIAVLHANVGVEVGAHFLETFIRKFHTLLETEEDVENKELDNTLLIISHLYNFKVFHSVLMHNILDELSQHFSEKRVELILLILRSVGFSLRKDDPLALKNLVLKLQRKASESSHLRDNTRVRFMLDVLLAVKNNNMSKIPQYDPTNSEHLKKLIKTIIHKGKYVTELKVTLLDILKADERGRWWIVGSAWTGTPVTPVSPQAPPATSEYSQSVLELAHRQHINTNNRRNIFCILVTAEDYLDAFEKLLRLGLKSQQEQEIIHVMVHCLMQEKTYNPYYAHLATHFCQADRKHQMSIQYHLWDRLKELSKLEQYQITNLAKFLAHLFLEKALPISVLKVIQFSEMDKWCMRLLRQVLLTVLLHELVDTVAAVFMRVSRSEKLHMFRESLRLFLHHFVLRNLSDLPTDQTQLLKDRVRLAETALTSGDTKKLSFF